MWKFNKRNLSLRAIDIIGILENAAKKEIYVIRHLVLWVVMIGFLGASCGGPRRLKHLSQDKDKKLTEATARARRLVKDAQELFDQKKYQEAQDKCLAALKDDPAQYKAHLMLADIYEIEGDQISALVELIAHSETVPKGIKQLERMLPYIYSKFTRDPSTRNEINREEKYLAVAQLSQAVALARKDKPKQALTKLDQVRKGIPRTGLVDFYEGFLRLKTAQTDAARAAFIKSIDNNTYFANYLLSHRRADIGSNILTDIEKALARGVEKYRMDTECAFLLGSVRLRLQQPQKALEAVEQSLSWGEPRWDLLIIKALAQHRLGQEEAMKNTLIGIKKDQASLSLAFHLYWPSLFHGLLSDMDTKRVIEEIAPVLDEPIRSYFLWRLMAELDQQQANALKVEFFKVVEKEFDPEEFKEIPNVEEPEDEPESLGEYMGMVQDRISEAMEAFEHCDHSRQKLRPKPDGRIVFNVELASDGTVGQIGIEQNTTEDHWLSFCVVRKLLVMKFPKPFRVTETFKLPFSLEYNPAD
jgi:tetratricopeptide (TPR) repeat protein